MGVLLLTMLVALLALLFMPRLQQRPIYELVRAEHGAIERLVEAGGHVQLGAYTDIISPVSGNVTKLPVMIGEYVKAGRLLAEVEPIVESHDGDSRKAQLARLQAELAGAKAQYEFAELQFQRQTQLKAENATREESFESSRMNMQASAARVDAIQAQVRQLESASKEAVIRQRRGQVTAPVSGTVVAMHIEQGKNVQAGKDVLMRIASLEKMRVQVQVAEEDVTRLHPGMEAYFTTPGYPGRTWRGKLKQLLPIPVPHTGTMGKKAYYYVLFDVDNPDQKLLAGMTAEVRFVIDRAEDTIVVPASIIARPDDKGEQEVRVMLDNGTIVTRRVKIGVQNGDKAQVLSGLKDSDQVIVSP